MNRHRKGFWSRCSALAFVVLGTAVPANTSVYVDNRLGVVAAEKRVVITAPQPAQLVFLFQTNGKPDNEATQFLQAAVEADVRGSGMFSAVSGAPVTSGGILRVTVNNMPQKGAVARGAVVGMTFGLVGTVVTDQYRTTVEYLPVSSSLPITRSVEHAIYTRLGAKAAPQHADKVKSDVIAIKTIVEQSLAHALNDMAGDPVFASGAIVANASAVP
ncbi:hypothetical protein KX816_10560 [Sphingosinicellaceae bacterium]|nr:hypothetical protein KX816_10560 [Sphingosinicellaceae bacterium]